MNTEIQVIDHAASPDAQTDLQIASHSKAIVMLAESLGYQGSLSVGALEDGIRFYQSRSIESLFEMGKRLLLLKESCPHGDFSNRTELLGFSQRTARRLMQATLKFSKTANLAVLKASGNQSKLLELVTLDDDEISELNEGGSVAGITLDDVETMTASELRRALRDARADSNAKDELIAKKNEKIDELDSRLSQSKKARPNEVKAAADAMEQDALHQISNDAMAALTAVLKLQRTVIELRDFAEEHNLRNLPEQIDQTVVAVYQRIAQASADAGIGVDFEEMVTPAWLSGMMDTTTPQAAEMVEE